MSVGASCDFFPFLFFSFWQWMFNSIPLSLQRPFHHWAEGPRVSVPPPCRNWGASPVCRSPASTPVTVRGNRKHMGVLARKQASWKVRFYIPPMSHINLLIKAAVASQSRRTMMKKRKNRKKPVLDRLHPKRCHYRRCQLSCNVFVAQFLSCKAERWQTMLELSVCQTILYSSISWDSKVPSVATFGTTFTQHLNTPIVFNFSLVHITIICIIMS